MRTPRLEPVTAVKRRATEIIRGLRQDQHPVIITEHGRSAAVLMDIASYDELVSRLEVLEGLARGERAITERRVVSHTAARRRMRRWLGDRG
jgi:prevent-host-death family protein